MHIKCIYTYFFRIWDLTERVPLATAQVGLDCGGARSVAFSPDGGTVAVGLRNGTFLILDAEWVCNKESLTKSL